MAKKEENIKEPEDKEEDADLVWKEESEESKENKEKESDSVEAEELKEEDELEEKETGEKEEVAEDEEEQIEEDSTRTESGEDLEEESSKEEENPSTHEDIKRSDILRRDLNQFVRDNQPGYNLNPQNRGSSKKLITLILFILAIVVIGAGIYFMAGLGGSKKAAPTPTPSATAEPTPTPKALNRSDWSMEVLNGSGVTGAAKKIADQLKALGYPVVKVGNADKDDYTSNQFFVKKGLEDSVNLVILDIKDIIKIASISGELKDSTASARIIIGK